MRHSLSLTGGFCLRDGTGAELKVTLAKGKAIIAFLALAHEGRASRDELIENWWSDRPRTQAYQSLRRTLLALKRDLGDSASVALQVDRRQVSLNISCLDIDFRPFVDIETTEALTQTEAALALPTGEFLRGLVTRDPVGDAWIQDRSADFARHRLQVLERALSAAMSADDMVAAEQLGQRLLEFDPRSAIAHNALINAYLARGERSLAVRQGQSLRKLSASSEIHLTGAPVQKSPSVPSRSSSGAAEAVGQPHELNSVQRPGLLVMPFTKGDEAQATAQLAFGLADDLVVDLSRLGLLSILPPGTTSSLGMDAMGSLEAARSLGVDYVLSGSIESRKGDADRHFRLIAMLYDARRGNILWAERYERPDRDIWAVRTELSNRIASTASQATDTAEMTRVNQSGTRNRDAWTLRVKAQTNFLLYTRRGNTRARKLFTQAVLLDAGFTRAEAGIGWTHLEDFCFGWAQHPMASLEAAEQHARRALLQDKNFYAALHLLSYVELCRRDYQRAADTCAKARDDNPNDPDLLLHEGYVTSCAGAPDRGVDMIMQAFAINPLHPAWYHLLAGSAALDARRHRTAISELTRFIEAQKGPVVGVKAQAIRTRAAAHVFAGEMDRAIMDRDIYMSANPHFSVQVFRRTYPRQDRAVVEWQADALCRAGFPE